MQIKSALRELGEFPACFHVPHLTGAMIFGTLDSTAAAELMADEGWSPIVTSSGHALGCVWLSDFLASTAGPYRELTLTLLVSRQPLTVPWINVFTPLAAQLHADAVVCEYVLVLDNREAIAYGRELHGFDKHPGELRFEYGAGHFRFEVRQGAERVVRGAFRECGMMSQPAALAGLVRAHGFIPTLRLLTTRQHRLPVVTPRVVRQLRSDLFFSASALLQPWHHDDELVPGDAPIGRLLTQLAFQPTCVQRLLRGEGLMPLPLDSNQAS